MSNPPSDPGSVHTSKSTSPHQPDEERVYESVIIAKIEDDPSFAVLPLNVVFDDGKTLRNLFGFDPSKPLDSLKRSIRKFATLEGQEVEISIFMRIEQGSADNVVSKYVRDFSAEIRKCKGRHRYAKYDELVNLNKDKISKRYYCVPRTKKTDPQVASSATTGVHGTRGSNIRVETTTDSEATTEKEPAMQPSSAHILQVAAAKARKELSAKKSSQVIDSEQDDDDFQTQTKEPRARATTKKAAQEKEASTSKGTAAKGKSANVTPAKKTAAKGSSAKATPEKATRKSARKTPLKLTPLKISTVPSVRPKPAPPKNPPRKKRTASPASVSSGSPPAKNPRITTDFENEPVTEGQIGVAAEKEQLTDTAQPSSSNAQLLATFVQPTTVAMDDTFEHPTFRASPTPTTPDAGAGSSTAVTPVLGHGVMAELKAIKELILAENAKLSRRQYKLYAVIKEVKAENARLRDSVIELTASNAKIYDKIKLVGDQSAERKGTIATYLLRFFPLDVGGEFADVFLGCNWVQKHLPPLIARQIELLKKTNVNKQIGNGVMHFLFSPYLLSHFILGDSKKSLRSLKPINRPIPRGVTRVILPSVVEVMKKRVTLESKDDKENVKLVRAGFSDLFGNNRSTFLNQLAEYCKDTNDFLRAAFMCDKVFFEANKHFFKPGTRFYTEDEHREVMLKRDNIKEMLEREQCGLIKKEKKRKFVAPPEAVMEMRVNVGLDQLTARQSIEYIIDAVRDVGENYENLLFEKECGVKNVDALYKTILAEKKAAWQMADARNPPRAVGATAIDVQAFPPVFKDTNPKPSTSGARPSMKAIIAERNEEMNFPSRKATTSSSNTDAMVIDTDAGASDDDGSVFEAGKKKKEKKKVPAKSGKEKKAKRTTKDDELDVSTDSEDEGDMSLDDHTSDEGSDDEALAEQLNPSIGQDLTGEQETETEKEKETDADEETGAQEDEADNEEVQEAHEVPETQQEEDENEEDQHEHEEDQPAQEQVEPQLDSDIAANLEITSQQPNNPPVDDE